MEFILNPLVSLIIAYACAKAPEVEQNPKSIKLKEAKTIEAATLNLAIS